MNGRYRYHQPKAALGSKRRLLGPGSGGTGSCCWGKKYMWLLICWHHKCCGFDCPRRAHEKAEAHSAETTSGSERLCCLGRSLGSGWWIKVLCELVPALSLDHLHLAWERKMQNDSSYESCCYLENIRVGVVVAVAGGQNLVLQVRKLCSCIFIARSY